MRNFFEGLLEYTILAIILVVFCISGAKIGAYLRTQVIKAYDYLTIRVTNKVIPVWSPVPPPPVMPSPSHIPLSYPSN